MATVFDHNNQLWLAHYKRTNGAETYSKDLVRYQLPNWLKILKPQSAISTCPRLHRIQPKQRFKTVIQYLHSYPFKDPLRQIRSISFAVRCKRLIFFTAYREYAELMKDAGFNARFVPMAIDVDSVRAFRHGANEDHDAVLWFGNMKTKEKVFEQTKEACAAAGLRLDVWTNGTFNGTRVSQPHGWSLASHYAYGIGVGRCALELYALGLKVVVAGRSVGGLVMDELDALAQTATNYNGRVFTFSNDIGRCIQYLPESLTVDPLDIGRMDHTQYL